MFDLLAVFDAVVVLIVLFFFFQAEDGIRDLIVTGVQTCALPIFDRREHHTARDHARRHRGGGASRRPSVPAPHRQDAQASFRRSAHPHHRRRHPGRSEEHTSELQSRSDLVCRLLLEKKKKNKHHTKNKNNNANRNIEESSTFYCDLTQTLPLLTEPVAET